MATQPSSLSRLLAVTLGSLLGCAALPVAAIDMGDASVQSMQGQRLRIAVPYGSAPGQRVPVMAISVDSVQVPQGYQAPDPALFVISQPEHRNIIYLHSRERVTAPTLILVLNVASPEGSRVAYDVAVPPLRYAKAAPTETPPSAKKARRSTAKRNIAVAVAAKPPKAAPASKGDALFKTR